MTDTVTSVESVTDPYYAALVPVPPAWKTGICEVCHRATNGPQYAECRSCEQTIIRVTHHADKVVPVSLCEARGQLHHILRTYKSHNRASFQKVVAGLIGRFYNHHRECLGGTPDVVTSVPSTSGRMGEHPLGGAIKLTPALGQRYCPLLVPGEKPCTHNRPDDRAFAVTEDVRGLSVLLLDDTYTSGARLHSAASALQLAGARLAAALVVGRYVAPRDDNDPNMALLEQAKQRTFSWDVCCDCELPF